MILKKIFSKDGKNVKFEPNHELLKRYAHSSVDFEAKPVEEQKLLSIFYANNYDLITRIDEDLSLSVSATKMKMTDIDKGIALCNESITAFEQAKTDYSNISGGDIYFNDIWENSLSESGAPISEIDNIKKLLQDLKYNYYEKKAEFEENKKVITDMENKLIEIISSNPGIRQSEIYEMFEEQFKNDIRLILFHRSREKRISRLRSLNTYRLYYKKD